MLGTINLDKKPTTTTTVAQDPQKTEAKDWTIHQASNGLPYYYNMKTKKSIWIKPDCLKDEQEQDDATGGWKEYVTAEGHKFYYNQKLQKSLTKMPEELKNLQNKQNQKKNAAVDGVAAKAVDYMRKAQQKQDGNQVGKLSINIMSNIDENNEEENDNLEQVTKEQSAQIFMGLLKDKQITILHKWEQCQKLIQNDDRFNIIKAISEKKKIYHDFIDQLKQEQRKLLQSKQEQDKDNFFKMLEERNFDSSTKFYKVQQSLMPDPRWKAIDERERESLFQDFMDDIYANEKNKQRNQKKENMKLMREFTLQNQKITSLTKWEEFKDIFKDHPVFNELQPLDQLTCFSEVIQELEITEKDKRKEIHRLEEAKNRDNFRKLLKEHIDKKTLTYKTKWKNFMLILKDDTRLLNMFGQRGSTPKELFEDQLEVLKENHKKIKNDLKQLLKKNNISMNSELSFKQFNNKLNADDEYKQLKEETKQIYYQYYQEKAKSKEKEVSRKFKKAQKKMNKVLRKQNDINQDSKYQDYKQIIENSSSKYSILTQPQREAVFAEYVKSLRQSDQMEIENNVNDNKKETKQQVENQKTQKEEEKQKLKESKKNKQDKDNKGDDDDDEDEDNEKEKKKKQKDKEKRKKKKEKDNKDDKMRDEGEILSDQKVKKVEEKEEGEQSLSPEQKKNKKSDKKKKKKHEKSDKKSKHKKNKKKQSSSESSSSSRSSSKSRSRSKSKQKKVKKQKNEDNDSSDD